MGFSAGFSKNKNSNSSQATGANAQLARRKILESFAVNRFVMYRPTPFFFRKYFRKFNFVVHLMIESKERLWDLISNKGAHVYVCGGTNMGTAGPGSDFPRGDGP